MNEIQKIINELNEIIEKTEAINNKEGSISAKKREALRQGTEKLKELSERAEKLALKLGNEKLQIIAEEIEEIKNEREILDNKKSISSKDNLVDDKISGKKGYSDRKQIKASDELLQELSEKISSLKDEQTEKYNERMNERKRLARYDKKEDLIKEIQKLALNSSPLFKMAITKELRKRNLIQSNEELDKSIEAMVSISDLLKQDKRNWNTLNEERLQKEAMLKIPSLSLDDRLRIQKEIDEIRDKMVSYIHKASEYTSTLKKINELEERSKEFDKEVTRESLVKNLEDSANVIEKEYEEAKEKISNRMKEKDLNKKLTQLLSEKEPVIKRNMPYIPTELRTELCDRLQKANLLTVTMYHDFLDESEYTINEEIANISDIKELDEKIKNITIELEKNIAETEEYATRQKDLIIKEATEGLSSEEKEYLKKVEKYLKDLSIQRKNNSAKQKEYMKSKKAYNEANKEVEELLKEAKEIREGKKEQKTTQENMTPKSIPQEQAEQNQQTQAQPDAQLSQPALPALPDFQAQQSQAQQPNAQTQQSQTQQSVPPALPDFQASSKPKSQTVTNASKPKKESKLKRFIRRHKAVIVAGLIVLGAAIGFGHGSKKAPKEATRTATTIENNNDQEDETKPIIEILDGTDQINNEQQEVETEAAPVAGQRLEEIFEPVTEGNYDETEAPIYLEEEPESEEAISITPEMVQDAMRKSNLFEGSGENGYEVSRGEGQGTSDRNIDFFNGPLVFKKGDTEDTARIFEIQPDGTEIGMKSVKKDKIPLFIKILAEESNQKPEDVYRELTRESINPEETETMTEMPETENVTKPITEEVLKRAVYESGIIEKSSDDPYDIMNGNFSNHIIEKNIPLYCERPLEFEYDYNSNTAAVIRTLQDGSKHIIKFTSREAADAYLYSLHLSTGEPLENLYATWTNAPMDSLTKGVSR